MSAEQETIPTFDDCWNRIGVWRSSGVPCPKLESAHHCHNCEHFVAAGRGLLNRPPPQDYIEEWTRTLSAAKQVQSKDCGSVVVFRIGSEWLAFPSKCFHRIVDPRPVHSIPRLSNHLFTGLVNVDGDLLPLFSLQHLLKVSTADNRSAATQAPTTVITAAARMLVLRVQDCLWVFPVDEVDAVHQYTAQEIGAAATASAPPPEFVQLILRCNRGTVGILDPELVVNAWQRSLSS